MTLSVAPRDVHEAQVQFALERGLPAMLGVLSTHRLPYPSRSFDMAHCARCLIPWAARGTFSWNPLFLLDDSSRLIKERPEKCAGNHFSTRGWINSIIYFFSLFLFFFHQILFVHFFLPCTGSTRGKKLLLVKIYFLSAGRCLGNKIMKQIYIRIIMNTKEITLNDNEVGLLRTCAKHVLESFMSLHILLLNTGSIPPTTVSHLCCCFSHNRCPSSLLWAMWPTGAQFQEFPLVVWPSQNTNLVVNEQTYYQLLPTWHVVMYEIRLLRWRTA